MGDETALNITSSWWEGGHAVSSLEKLLDNQLTLHMDPNTKLHINSRPIIVSFCRKCSRIAGMVWKMMITRT